MTPIAGGVALNLAFGFSILTVITLFIHTRNGDQRLFLTGQRLALGISFFVFLATFILAFQLIQSNFDIDYVARYTSLETPFIYKISALWAGQSGSLLFWLFILSIYTTIVILQNQRKHNSLMPWVIITLVIVQIFFLILTNYVTNPFKPTDADFIVTNGNGLNPLLQNVTMAIHPPTLYLGFVGFTVPFAFAVAALISKNLDDAWIRLTRKWTVVSWFFLCMGNLFGASWAYVELGWGGYWAWDPVENAAFMPLIVATAYLHSVMIQEKKDMMKVWNMSLILLTFVMTIFGTFITRSGLIQSVHTFDEATLGYYFLGLLFFIIAACTVLIVLRLPLLKSENELDSFLSREAGFLFNNLLLLGIAFATFWGTIFPIISEAIRGVKITVGPPFYNQVNVPIGLALLALIGIGPIIAWRKATWSNLKKNFLKPVVFALVGGALLFPILPLSSRSEIYTYIAFILCIFVLSSMLIEFYKGTMARYTSSETVLGALGSLIWNNKRRYGGYTVHIGVVMIYAGIAASQSYGIHTEKVGGCSCS